MPAAPVHATNTPAPGLHAEAGMVFDFAGMLALARGLWSLGRR